MPDPRESWYMGPTIARASMAADRLTRSALRNRHFAISRPEEFWLYQVPIFTEFLEF